MPWPDGYACDFKDAKFNVAQVPRVDSYRGFIFACSGLFQALGNTMPSLATSTIRLLVAVVPGVWLSKQPGFELHELWYLGVVSVTAQLIISWWLLGRELKKKGL